VDGEALPKLTSGKGSSEREIDEGDLLCARTEEGGGRLWWLRCEARKGGGSGWGGARCGGERLQPLFIGAGRRWNGRAEHAVLVRPAASSTRLCRRRDLSGSDEFMAVATRWCYGQDPSGRSVALAREQAAAAASGGVTRAAACGRGGAWR
jgi:hypothetical protein